MHQPYVLSPSEVAQVRQRIVEQAAAEKALGWAREDAGPTQLKKILKDQRGALTENVPETKEDVNQRMNMLLNKGKLLRDLVTQPVALELAEHALGVNFLLSSFTANIAKKGECSSRSIATIGGIRCPPRKGRHMSER